MVCINNIMKKQEIRTTPDEGNFWDHNFSFSGFFDKKSEFVIYNNQTGETVASVSGYKLYRLAKAIVKRYEKSKQRRI